MFVALIDNEEQGPAPGKQQEVDPDYEVIVVHVDEGCGNKTA